MLRNILLELARVCASLASCVRLDLCLEWIFGYKARVVTRVDGGLGSQIWQFAFGYSVAKVLELPLYIDLSAYDSSKMCKDINGNDNRKFLLFDLFPNIRNQFSTRTTGRWHKLLFKLLERPSTKTIFEIEPTIYEKRFQFLNAYYTNYRYINENLEELREIFTFEVSLTEEEELYKQQILSTSSCFVHIRRGDFVGSSHEVCSEQYYICAMNLVSQKLPHVTFYIFSNDEQYARQLCDKVTGKKVFIENRTEENPGVDMYLMSLCKHAVISNSGFSWFPAWINSDFPGQVVVAPKYWTARPELREISVDSMRLPTWYQLDC